MEDDEPFQDSGSEWTGSNPDGTSSDSTSISSPSQRTIKKKKQSNVERAKKDLFANNFSLQNGLYECVDDIANVVEEVVTEALNFESSEIPNLNKSDSTSDKPSSSHCTESVSNQPSGQEQKANILIKDSTATLTVLKSLHRGTYTVLIDELNNQEDNLADNSETNVANMLNKEYISFIIADQNTPQQHLCQFDDKNIPCYISIDDKKTMNLNVRWCLSPGELSGAVSLTGNNLIAGLIYAKLNQNDLGTKSELKTKAHCCLFCSKHVTVLPRHLLTKHLDRDEVKEVEGLPLKSKERAKLLKKLRIQGDNLYNENCCSKDRIPVRVSKKIAVEKMVPCSNCKALFVPKSLYKHHQNCVNRPKNRPQILKEARRLADGSSSQSLSNSNQEKQSSLDQELLRELLEPLKNDEISKIIRQDKTLLKLAQSLAKKNCACRHNYRNCRQTLRLGARVFFEMNKLNPNIRCVQDFLDTVHYRNIIEVVKLICSGDKYTFKTPTIVAAIRLTIIKLVNVLISDYRMQGLLPTDGVLLRLSDFKNFHEGEFLIQVGKTAYISTQKNRMFKSRDLPNIGDIGKLTEYLQTEAEKCYRILKEKYNYNSWIRLGTLILHQVVLFNRRRPGEVSRILLQSYLTKRTIRKEDHGKMTRMEVMLAERFTLIQLIGKRARVLSALLSNEQIKNLDLFISFRKMSGISESNEFLFCSTNTDGHLEAGGRALRIFAEKCGADNPKLLRCTRLRKQVATVSQFLVLNENEIQQLADFMGHDVSVHKANYRQPELQREITILSRFFMAAGGDLDVSKFKGKTMTELEVLIDTEPTLEETDEEVEDIVDAFLGVNSCNSSLGDVSQTSTTKSVTTAAYPSLDERSYNSNLDEESQTSTIRPVSTKSNETVDQSHDPLPCCSKQGPIVRLERLQKIKRKRSPIKTRSAKLRITTRKLGSCSHEEEPVKKIPTPKKRSPLIMEILNEIRSPVKRNKRKRRYTEEEVTLLSQAFKAHINTGRMPSKQEFKDFIAKNRKVFFDRTHEHLYSFLQYRFKILIFDRKKRPK